MKTTKDQYTELLVEQVHKRDRRVGEIDQRQRRLLWALAYGGDPDNALPVPSEWAEDWPPRGIADDFALLDADGMRVARNIFALSTAAIEEGGGVEATRQAVDWLLTEDRCSQNKAGAGGGR